MWIRAVLVVLIVSPLILAALPSTVQAIPTVNLMICRDLTFQNLGARGSQATPIGCGREFSTSIPYVVLYMEFSRIEIRTPYAWQLSAPNDEVYARASSAFNPPYPGIWTYYVYRILPVAAAEKEIVEKNSEFRFGVIEVGAKPVSEMPGEWKLQVSLDRGAPVTVRFSLRP